ncbi:MAG: hypothetical protein R6X35_07295 [Candidatus Krumholzibacteriia bacterium]
MKKRVAMLAAAVALAAVILLGGCSPDNELGGLPIPNVLPDTRITGEPPNVIDSGFQVRFYWTGHDPDGKIKAFQWKLSTNSTDGISVQDTLTIDPATGNILHPWHTTTRTDSLFIVTADMNDYPGDSDLPAESRRAYQIHTLFVRAVDEEGGVDPTPAFISFTATTLLPTIRVDRPTKLLGTAFGGAPPTVSIGYLGTDADFELNAPVKVRYLWKPAIGRDGRLITSYAYLTINPENVDFLASFSDSGWSPWMPYRKLPEQRMIVFPDQAARMRDSEGEKDAVYLFAIQAMDTAGAVNIDRTLRQNVLLVQIDRALVPVLVVAEQNLGLARITGTYQVFQRDIAQGQILQFNWSASALDYGGQVVAYRYGWDLADPEDENDPGWAVMPGSTLRHRQTDPVSFDADIHTLTVQAWDNSGQMSRATFVLTVVPVPPPLSRRDVLLVDSVPDRGSRAWESASGRALDEDQWRDAFWQDFLTSPGGVDGFDPGLDVVDCQEDEQALRYRLVVNYKTLLWTVKDGSTNWTRVNFAPLVAGPQYIWLVPYQEMVGNLFLVGDMALTSFIENQPRGFNAWMLPWIFTAPDDRWCTSSGTCWGTGFGVETLPDGTTQEVGPTRYPYRALGVALLDRFVPDFVYSIPAQQGARKPACAGLKGLFLDDDFASVYLPEGAPFASTIMTELTIDWKDPLTTGIYANEDINLGTYFWKLDEFYEDNVGSDRPTSVRATICDGRPCLDVMFRAYTRYDFINDDQASLGNTDWPFDIITPPGGIPGPRFSPTDKTELNGICGSIALRWPSEEGQEPYTRIGRGTAGGKGVPVGFISHKLERNKPTPVGDVIWGFDPYRFDHREIRKVIRWVLGEHFGLQMKPGGS